MFFDFNLKSSILLIFFLHGIVFATLLFIKSLQTGNKSTLWLSLFTILCSLYIAPFMLGYSGWYSKQPYRDILFYIPFQQLFVLPPVLFFYIKTLLDKSFRFTKTDYIHFIPAFLYGFYSIVIFLHDKIFSMLPDFYSDGKDKDLSPWYQVAGLLSLSYYLIESLKTYYRYKKLTYNIVSFADSVMFKWAKRFLIAFLMLIAIRILFFILNPEWDEFGRKFWYYVSFSILFYYISISGYTNSIISTTYFKDSPPDDIAGLKPGNSPLMEPDRRIASPEDTLQQNEIPDLPIWKEKIERLMLVDRLYENPELVISDLSNQLGTHTKKISQVINQGFSMNFNDYVNHHRILALEQKFKEGEHNLQTILSLAFECGFNSKSTFNRAFKRVTNLSPKDFIEKNYAK